MENEIKEPVPKYDHISIEQYLEMENESPEKHEYYCGEIFAMSGASVEHNIIHSNIIVDLGNKLKGKGCRPLGSDLRVHVKKNSLFTYPDISIYCGDIQRAEYRFDTALNPTVIIEILSPFTHQYDRSKKFDLYRDIDTLKDYILVDSQSVHVLKYERNEDNSWLLTEYKTITQQFSINSIHASILLSDIYEGTGIGELVNE